MINWTKEKPEFKDECLLMTATKIRDKWEYNLWLIEKQVTDEGWYWGWLTSDGEEYGDIADLKADLYATIPKLK